MALLLPGLVRNYAHGVHMRRLAGTLGTICELHVFICVWALKGSPANHFAQSADKAAAAPVEMASLVKAYPTASAIELVGMDQWVDMDGEGNDGRYINQWAMVRRCWDLMERSMPTPAQYVIRARPDLRVACLPLCLHDLRRPSYLAIQERLWGSDCFFYGDHESMRAVCEGLAPRYDEYTQRLGHASSEPMLHEHIKESGLDSLLVRFARCCSVDRS